MLITSKRLQKDYWSTALSSNLEYSGLVIGQCQLSSGLKLKDNYCPALALLLILWLLIKFAIFYFDFII